MIKIENVETYGWEAAFRGMRNPKNSWGRADSCVCDQGVCPMIWFGGEPALECDAEHRDFCIGKNDMKLACALVAGGPVHAKFRRMLTITMDVTAPLYWWKEFDTYKVGTVANSCSTMHKIHSKEFVLDDFSIERLDEESMQAIKKVIWTLNRARSRFIEAKDKNAWWQMIQLLPSSYNQKRTIQLNYETAANIYLWRHDHKLDEWHVFCDHLKALPYADQLIIKKNN